MTVREYNKEFLLKITGANCFISLFENIVSHIDKEKADHEEIWRIFKIYGWSEETKQTILTALEYYRIHEGIEKLEINGLKDDFIRRNNMTREEQLRKEYEDKLSALRREQSNCNHEWGEVRYDPEITREPCGYRTVGQGSHVWTEPEGYCDVEHKRWSRTCKKCGKVEYTKEQVATKYEPKF